MKYLTPIIIALSCGSAICQIYTGSLTKNHLNVIDYAAGATITDGMTDAGPAFQAAINACDHCIIDVPNVITQPGGITSTAACYNIVTPLIGHGHMTLQGTTNENAHLNGLDAGSTLCMGQSAEPMFTFPGEGIDGDNNVGWSFRHLRFDGKDVAKPIIYSPEINPGRGAWSAVIEENVFYKCRPCISAQNGWDWWIRNNAFNESGNGSDTAALKIFNSAQTYTGAGSNSWHIDNNFFDLLVGKGIDLDSTGAGSAIQFFYLTSNKFGPKGYESITGCLFLSTIANNQSEGSATGLSTFNLSGTNASTGCGRNRFMGNTFASPGVYSIVDAGALDIIESNTFYVQGSSGAHILLTGAINTVANNKTNDVPCCNTFPLVSDMGSSNSIFHNDGLEGVVSQQFIPEKLVGTQYYVPLFSNNTYQIDGNWPTYVPTLTCLTGGTPTTASALGYYKRIGNTVFVTVTANITTAGSCVNLQATLPSTAYYSGTLFGKEIAVSGKAVVGFFNGNSNVVLIQDYAGSGTIANGYNFVISGQYPSQ